MSESMIRILNRTREYLKQIPKELHSSEYFLLMDKITETIRNHCSHSVVRDLIDIDPDQSQTIFYCEKCFTTFDDNDGRM